jgi:hypothetical protein
MVIDAPADWNDQSSIILVGPLNVPLRTQPRVQVTRRQMTDPTHPSEMAAHYVAGLPSAVEGCRILEDEPLTLRGLPAHRIVFQMLGGSPPPKQCPACQEYMPDAFKFCGYCNGKLGPAPDPPGGPGPTSAVIRMQVFATRGNELFVLTSDVAAEAFAQIRPALDRIMSSFRFESEN